MMGGKGDLSKFLPKKRLMGEITECYILLNSVCISVIQFRHFKIEVTFLANQNIRNQRTQIILSYNFKI